MKKAFTVLMTVFCLYASAQNVGINTNAPAATLQVVGQPASTTAVDGVMIPSLTGDQLKAKDAVYTTQNGAMIFVTTAVSTATTKTANVTTPGFYYFDGSIWQRVGRSVQKGQILNSVFIDDPAMVLPVNFNLSTFTNLISYSYTPVHNNSTIMVQYHNSNYTISGGYGLDADEFQSQISINGSARTVNVQQPSQAANVNGTFRTGSLFPITGVADNSVTSPITITIQLRKSSGDDHINFNGTNGTLIIQEIAK